MFGSSSTFHEILVIEYIADYKSLSNSDLERLSNNLLDSQYLTNCPNGTIIGKLIDGRSNNQNKIYYPLFPHLSFPIKAGERAWTFERKNHQVSYWVSRKVQNISAEDLNFTHDDRAILFPSISNDLEAIKKNSTIFYDSNSAPANLEKVRKNALARKDFIGQPVSPLKSKTSDFTIQGSNGSVISLTDMGKVNSATIEIATGLIELESDKKTGNSDGYEEAIKPTDSIELKKDVKSRITISELFNADDYYESAGSDTGSRPTIVLKTDAIRFLAGNNIKIIVGPSDSQSIVEIQENGDISIDAYRNLLLAGQGSSQPYLRYDEFRKVVTGLENIYANLQTGLQKIAVIVDSLAGGVATTALSENIINIGIELNEVELAMRGIRSKKIYGS